MLVVGEASRNARRQVTYIAGLALLCLWAVLYMSSGARRAPELLQPTPALALSPDQIRLKTQVLDSLYDQSKQRRLRRLVLTAAENEASHSRSVETLVPGSVRDIAAIADPLPQKAIVANVPRPVSAADPRILFALATTVERLISGLTPSSPPAYQAIAHFATPETSFLIVLPKSDEPEVRHLLPRLHAAGIRAEVVLSDLETWDERWAWTIERLAAIAAADETAAADERNPLPPRPWYGMLDDDTFFPRIGDIWTMLERYSDPLHKTWYVGAEAEPNDIQDNFPSHAMGGAGVFLSAGLLRQLDPLLKNNACPSPMTLPDHAADVWLALCVNSTMGVKVSWEKALHMIHDVSINIDGVYEGPGELSVDSTLGHRDRPRLLSMHHWKRPSVARDLPSMASLSRKIGSRGLFHRYMIWDDASHDPSKVSNADASSSAPPSASRGFWVMTNGYSLVHHNLERPAQRQRDPWCDTKCWDPAGGDDWNDPVERILSTTEINRPGVFNRIWGDMRPSDSEQMSSRFSFRAAVEGRGDEPWTGFFVHETDALVDVVEVIWI